MMKLPIFIHKLLGHITTICPVCSKEVWHSKRKIAVYKRSRRTPGLDRVVMKSRNEMCDKCWEIISKMI